MAQKITDANFQEMIDTGKPVVVDFWAEWCGPCRMIGPAIDELAEQYGEKIIIGKVNVDENEELPARFGIRGIPTLLFFKGGELIDRHVGATQKQDIEEKIRHLLL
ncbi:MAG: thioredoxin [Dysgonamonadaceae bacterium]|jgi:thioredoxin 1|nr:thioredoxin [Dysgonamonadaceae bacterium]